MTEQFEETEEILDSRADALVQDHWRMIEELIGHRKKHKLSQADVAFRMGVTQPTVSDFESDDSNPTLSTIRRYAMAVGARLNTEVADEDVSQDHDQDEGPWND
ncbi:XRE family transcriptional regulator [Acidipropionibacterium acidipropionici]|jgi:transcriptional regulator with XRE-family HTH domain|uniref:Transcriptional regulator n=2 Tax=Acidipropionibacterium acidipropionici TaxID=1748 RepID=A0AAC8YEK0_9ACTN|nr:helix-turn-helix transcriptional regulator [Acidipropionibacterium acidipropionici]AFV89399.1 Transcriptional regulator, XRE family [Acidipropionibacterium acidipropionici ATCC 4875]AMS04622.1 XRE family transcriptional regulator [Acidipropionibacterium acidipropionici]AOZ46112.1 transcriptional regulator [Acidipropionibacterium acidipropionici]AZP37859.1 XRE family transcriptional regulator [Acidipropionibacterium acidipropionici]